MENSTHSDEEMIHRGEAVENAIRTSGFSISSLAKKLKINRATLYNRFADPHVTIDFIKEVGKIINHDFSNVINELNYIPPEMDLKSKGVPETLEESNKELFKQIWENSRMRSEYVELSKKHIKLLEHCLSGKPAEDYFKNEERG